jgi:molybdopterin converting factor small subunit
MKPTIIVYVKLYATLTRSVSGPILAQHPQGLRAGSRLEVELPEGSTLTDLVDYLALPKEEIKVSFVNAKAQDMDYRLEPGDEVGIFPPIGGGAF